MATQRLTIERLGESTFVLPDGLSYSSLGHLVHANTAATTTLPAPLRSVSRMSGISITHLRSMCCSHAV